MNVQTAVEDDFADPCCWCCGAEQPSEAMVHLGNHPEVTICRRCAHSLHRQALAAQGKPLARLAWRIRQAVVRRGWQHSRLIGRPLRWLGRHLP